MTLAPMKGIKSLRVPASPSLTEPIPVVVTHFSHAVADEESWSWAVGRDEGNDLVVFWFSDDGRPDLATWRIVPPTDVVIRVESRGRVVFGTHWYAMWALWEELEPSQRWSD
jgi:hypothetical protein